ncbi:hypothetical protein [Puniceicoccus vermicola]|uniref:Uncharacterized protein n=1 Tax=Puniceicoccus vermicola TaxID=388746 RepID=A0A7X1B282_9BACT|nr:hypothetical protein [Puniceicoccus vermicola]MBC2604172.1 hypothetical protein [Puniceicoccus vermicola]
MHGVPQSLERKRDSDFDDLRREAFSPVVSVRNGFRHSSPQCTVSGNLWSGSAIAISMIFGGKQALLRTPLEMALAIPLRNARVSGNLWSGSAIAISMIFVRNARVSGNLWSGSAIAISMIFGGKRSPLWFPLEMALAIPLRNARVSGNLWSGSAIAISMIFGGKRSPLWFPLEMAFAIPLHNARGPAISGAEAR